MSKSKIQNKSKIPNPKQLISVKDTRGELSKLAARFYRYPSKKMKVIGITGTNGKTTTAFLINKILEDSGHKTGLVGTIVYKIGKRLIAADRTTPDALTLEKILFEMAKVKTDYVVMEVSSHALEQKRANDIYYDIAVFTNITPEHLDYHKDMNGYFAAKSKIFKQLKEQGVAVLNLDDPRTKKLTKKIDKKILTYGLNPKADVYPVNIRSEICGSEFIAATPYGSKKITTHLFGEHNISNILAAISVGLESGIGFENIAKSISGFRNVRGRLEKIDLDQGFGVFIDYAHTEDALRRVLSCLSKYAKRNIITVFGCGGDRDRTKRPLMGKAASQISDYVIITSDNPRSEDPEKIANEIERGILKKSKKSYSVILDRDKAINKAISMARKDDLVLIAGKGHETEQIVGSKKIHFNDREIAESCIKNGFKRYRKDNIR